MWLLICLSFYLTILKATSLNLTSFWQEQIRDDEIDFQSFSGYQEIDWYRNLNESGIYYSLFGAKGFDLSVQNSKVPLFIWLQGGPGASSQYGAYAEVGPIRIINQKPTIKHNSLNLIGHMLFIDQPLNVGFSFDSQRDSGQQVSNVSLACDHLLNFLYNFYKQWPKLQNTQLYIIGEQFGGRYAIGLAKLLISNSTFQSLIKYSLQGVLISSGWIDPINQFNYYDSLLYSAGIVSNRFRDICSSFQTKGIVNIYKKLFTNASEDLQFLVKNDNISDVYWGGMSYKNIRIYQEEDISLNQYIHKFSKSLGGKQGLDFILQNENVYNSFRQDLMKSYTQDLLFVIRSKKVLVFSGQNDYIVNSAGVQNYLNALSWSRINAWKGAKKQPWIIHSQVKGWAKILGNLWYVLVNGAGHKICLEQPDSCFTMIGKFIHDDRNWN